MAKPRTTTDNYAQNARRVLHLMDEKQRGFHAYLEAETDGFTTWDSALKLPAVREKIRSHFGTVNGLLEKVVVDKGYSGYRTEGRAYRQTRDLDIGEIAKLVRKELALEFPGCEFSVRIDRYAGGQSLDVYILDVDFEALSEELKRWVDDGKTYNDFVREEQRNGLHGREAYFNERYFAFEKKVSRILNQYRMDDSDSMVDYFHTNFYGHVHRPEVEYLLAKRQNPNLRQEQKRQERQQREAQAANAAKRKQELKEVLGDFKKGEYVYYVPGYDHPKGYFQKGERHLAEILKVPNGRARYGSQFTIALYLPLGKFRNPNYVRKVDVLGQTLGYFNTFDALPTYLEKLDAQAPNDTETARARLRLLALKLQLQNKPR